MKWHPAASTGTFRRHPLQTGVAGHSGITVLRPVLLILVLMACCMNNAIAVQWSWTPKLGVGTTYRSSDRENPSPQFDGFQFSLTPSAGFSATGRHISLVGSGRYNFNRFSEGDGGDEDNRLLRLDSTYKLTHHVWNIIAELKEQNTLRNLTEDTGVVFDETTRKNKSLRPSWIWKITARDNLSVNFSTSETSYDNISTTNLRDFSSNFGSATLSHRLGARTSVFGTLSSSFFEFDDESNESTTVSANIGFNHSFSARWSSRLSLGKRKTDSINRFDQSVGIFLDPTDLSTFVPTDTILVEADSENSGATYAGSINYTGAKNSFGLDANRTTRIDATRGQIISDRFTLTARRRINARWNTFLQAGLTRSEDVGEVSVGNDRLYQNIQANVRWKPTRRFTTYGSIKYFKQEPLNDSSVDETTRFIPSIRATWDFALRWSLAATYKYSDRDSKSGNSDEKVHSFGLTLIHSWPTMTLFH